MAAIAQNMQPTMARLAAACAARGADRAPTVARPRPSPQAPMARIAGSLFDAFNPPLAPPTMPPTIPSLPQTAAAPP